MPTVYVLTHKGAIIGPAGFLRTTVTQAIPFWTDRAEAEEALARTERTLGKGEVGLLALGTVLPQEELAEVLQDRAQEPGQGPLVVETDGRTA